MVGTPIFDEFQWLSISLPIFSLKVHFRWEHHILSMKECHAIRPEYNCFISLLSVGSPLESPSKPQTLQKLLHRAAPS